VVARSRPVRAALALAVALAAFPIEALAADGAAVPASTGPSFDEEALPDDEEHGSNHERSPEPEEESYRGLLAATYALAPFVSLAIGGVLSEHGAPDESAVLAASTMFLAPAIVHMSHGRVEHGPLSFLGLAGSTALGVVLGGAAGYAIDSADCDPDQDSDSCDFAGIAGAVVGSLLGGVSGYTAFAVYDVSSNGAVSRAPDRSDQAGSDQAAVQLWLTPLRASKRERSEGTTPVDGVLIGATLQL
jgi:hypothetical protein